MPVHINSLDFSLGHHAHADQPDDTAMQHFSIARDRLNLLPMIHAAQRAAGRPLKLMASPWSPPAWMKRSQRMADGGHLLPLHRDAGAQCFVCVIQAYQAKDVPILRRAGAERARGTAALGLVPLHRRGRA